MGTWKDESKEYRRLLEDKYYNGVAKYEGSSDVDYHYYPYESGYSYNQGFSFRKPTADRTYVKTLQILDEKGPLTKRELLTELTKIGAIPPREEVETLDYKDIHNWTKSVRGVDPEEYWKQPDVSPRGQHSAMFLAMRRAGLVDYDRHTLKWSIAERGKKLLKDNNLEK